MPKPALNTPSSGPPRNPRRKHWAKRRKIAVVLALLIICMPFAVAGWYAKSVTNAIGDAQDVAVVDLPTRTGSENQQPDTSTPASDAAAKPANDDPSSFDVARGLYSAGTGGEDTSPETVWPGKRYLNIMVLGIDTRPDGGDQNADVIIIARIDLQEKTMNSVSIPRDLLVEIPGTGQGKINGAYGAGVLSDPSNRAAGVAAMRDTIEHNFGIVIDDYVLIDFEGFTEVVDSVGGIDIDVPTRIEDHEYPTEDYGTRTLIIEAGPQHMDGETALAYARTRHGDSDDQRRERQMLVIESLFSRGKNLGTITRVADVITALSTAAQTSFHWQEQLALAALALNMDKTDITMVNIGQPLVEPGTAENGAWVYVGDPEAISAFIESSLAGDDVP